MKRLFIVHGWSGSPDEGWFPWVKRNLSDYEVHILKMPSPDKPDLKKWVYFLSGTVGSPKKDDFFIGHSIGCQTIIRYLETIKVKVGGVVLVAPWVHLKPAAFDEPGAEKIARPWMSSPINWEAAAGKSKGFVAIFSDNDPYVSLDEADIFKDNLGAKIVIEKSLRHMSGSDKVFELPSVLEALEGF